MRICLIGNMVGGGIRNHILSIKKELEKRHEVHIVSSQTEKMENYHKVSSFGPGFYKVCISEKDFYEIIKKINPDVIHSHHPFGTFDFFDSYKKPRVATIHNPPFIYSNKIDIAKLHWKKAIKHIKKAKKIICVSNFIAKNSGIRLSKLEVVPNGVDKKVFHPVKREGSKKLELVFVGRLSPEKGVKKLLEIADILTKKEINYNLRIVGFGPLAEWIKLKSDENKNIQFVGRVRENELKKYYSNADLTVFPSTWGEGFGMIITESMACGTPVIAFDTGAQKDIIKEGKTGFIVSDVTGEALAKKILEVRKTVKKMRKNCIREANKYSWPLVAKKIEKIYKEII